MCRRIVAAVGVSLAFLALLGGIVMATDAELYFSLDKNGEHRVTQIQEGESVWFVIYDPDENLDCDVRDKIWTEVKLVDPKTGAHSAWVSYLDANGDANGRPYDHDPGGWLGFPDYEQYRGHDPGNPGWLGGDYLEETGADTGLFVSKRSFQIGTRENYDVPRMNTHVVCSSLSTIDDGGDRWLSDFVFGGFFFHDGVRMFMGALGDFLPKPPDGFCDWDDVEDEQLPDGRIRDPNGQQDKWLVGRFENMDTLIGIYQDPNDDTDIAIAMMKITDVEAALSWNREIYPDCNGAATILIEDWDENLSSSEIEYVPVFILVNPGSWNPVRDDSPTTFCALKRTGGVRADTGGQHYKDAAIRWYNIYHAEANAEDVLGGGTDGRYYVEYPTVGDGNVTSFDTVNANGLTAVSFYAQETGVNTGVFQLNLNSICEDLGFNSLHVRDVLVAYYLDPNDFDDFKLAAAYIEERHHSITRFTDEDHNDQSVYWIGRDPIYVHVIDANANVDPCCPEEVLVHLCDPHGEDDAEWWILDETSSNSPVFFSHAGMQLLPVWDALGAGVDPANTGGFQLQLDNWIFETFNEDEVYARYNDQYYGPDPEAHILALPGAGDVNLDTSFPPWILRTRVANDVSFDLVSIGDTQVFDGRTTHMWFLDRQGNRVSNYVNSDCVFVEVIDPDQNEDTLRRERIDAFWSGGEGGPIGAMSLNDWDCGTERILVNDWNLLFPDTNILNNAPANGAGRVMNSQTGDQDLSSLTDAGWGMLYVANLRNGRWAPIDLLETGISTGTFVSVICINLIDVHGCVPTLGALPGDTIVAVYQDPSNHSDSAWISIKVGIGGGGTPPTQASTTTFVDGEGAEVTSYAETDLVYVRVADSSHTARLLVGALTIEGEAFDLAAVTTESGVYATGGITLDLLAGESITATYTDPTDPTDTSSDTIPIIASALDVVSFIATPNPFDGETEFTYEGSDVASVMSVMVYDLAGKIVWAEELANVTGIVWDGTDEAGNSLANGGYIYVITATDGTNTFNGKGTVFVNR